MTIRAAAIGDIPIISDIRTRSWQFIYRGRMPDTLLDAIDPKGSYERWRAMINGATPRSRILVSAESETVTGFIALEPAGEPNFGYAGYLSALYLEPACIGRGLGRALFESACDWMREAGYPDLFWWVIAVNPYARPFYEKMGGRRIGSRSFEAGGETFEEYAYGLDLGGIRA